MGIHGIYKEIGPGKRIALSKLALNKFEETGRPLRIAIDTSIWLFQVQASKGGTNPALRTFYYRLLRLIALSIHPVFVFDGPNKPPFKRNKRTGPNVASIPEFLAKQLLKQFGFPIHLAPGEAEAECALLQREGIVDAVLSEDVDTLMFGSGITIRNWSPEKSGSTPTHVSVYDAVETKNGPSGLDREGMILVALMSGGDYVPEGIPGCGPKTAVEAAKAGFGSHLCNIPTSDKKAMSEWRERLQHELQTNESKFFKRKHSTLKIPGDFPRLDILGYYTHPAISNQTSLDKLKRSIRWDQDLDFSGLRSFTHDAFDWIQLEGAKHFIRSLAPSLVIRQLRMRAEQQKRSPTTNLEVLQQEEARIIQGIHGKRQHPVTDNSTELRVSFTPGELVRIDLDKEEPDSEFDAGPPGSQADVADLEDDPPLEFEEEGPRKRGPTKFDPQAPARIWVLESFVKVGVPLKVQDWEVERQAKLKPKRTTAPIQESDKSAAKAQSGAKKTRAKNVAAPQTTMNQFAKVTKPGVRPPKTLARTRGEEDAELGLPKAKAGKAIAGDAVSFISSSPVQNPANRSTPRVRQDKASSSVLEDLPASVTKRRRAPLQRSRTLPANPNTYLERPATPPPEDTIETLDLVWSPALPAPLPIPPKNARPRPFSRRARNAPPASSPGGSKQTTLDVWRASVTPTKQRDTLPTMDASPISAPTALQPKTKVIETLDLTLSSPPTAHALPPRTRRTAAAAATTTITTTTANTHKTTPPPITQPSITCISSPPCRISTSSQSSTNSAPNPPTKRKDASPEPHRRTSPRLRKSLSLPPEIDTLDLTTPPRHPYPHPQPPTPPCHPRTVTPPAAWKARGDKKRQIRLRDSVVGAWDFVDVDGDGDGDGDTPPKLVRRATAVPQGGGKQRRKWRESEVEVLDFT